MVSLRYVRPFCQDLEVSLRLRLISQPQMGVSPEVDCRLSLGKRRIKLF